MNLNLSEEAIEKKAIEIRAKVHMEHVYALDMEIVLGLLSKRSSVFRVRKATPGEIDDDEAFMDCETHTMVLSPKTFEGLKSCEKRDRFTAAHELGHYVLGHKGNTKRTNKNSYLTPHQLIQEQQADKFAAFLLVPTELARACQSVDDICARFQVSSKTAEIALERIQSVLRKESGQPRRPPATVLDYLRKLEKEGRKIRSDISMFEGDLR